MAENPPDRMPTIIHAIRRHIPEYNTNRTKVQVVGQIQKAILLVILFYLLIAGFFGRIFTSVLLQASQNGTSILTWDFTDTDEFSNKATEKVDPIPAMIYAVIACYAILFIGIFVQLWAAVRLVDATISEISPTCALKLTRNWRNVTIIFLAADFWTCFVLLEWNFLLGYGYYATIVRCICLFNVNSYIKELEKKVMGPPMGYSQEIPTVFQHLKHFGFWVLGVADCKKIL